jgi:hypothetical protein
MLVKNNNYMKRLELRDTKNNTMNNNADLTVHAYSEIYTLLTNIEESNTINYLYL